MNRPQRIGFPFQNAFENFMINPMTNWQRFFNPQFYINYNAGDVDVENNVLREVGSYVRETRRLAPDEQRACIDAIRGLLKA